MSDIVESIQSSLPEDSERILLLQEMPIFGALSAEAIAFLEQRCEHVEMPAGQFFFHEGDPAQSLYILERGYAEALKQCGKELRSIRALTGGESFGEMAICDMNPRGASVKAITDCTALELPASALYELYQFDLEQFTLIQMNMLREISRRLRYLNDKLAKSQPEMLDKASRV